MDGYLNTEIFISFLTLTLLEVILGIDNIVVISILAGKLPPDLQKKARISGLSLALISRLLLLFSIVWLASLTKPIFSVFDRELSVRDLVLLGGGLFLLVKATHEIHGVFDLDSKNAAYSVTSFGNVIFQIVLIDLVFSLDSIITAIGMAQKIGVMVAAVICAMVLMLFASGIISEFIHKYPTLKMLALSFLLMVGITLIAEGVSFHIPKGYIYFAMGFSGFVETLNILTSRKRKISK